MSANTDKNQVIADAVLATVDGAKIATSGIIILEYIDADGEPNLATRLIGDPPQWQIAGMLRAGVIANDEDHRRSFFPDEEGDDD